VHARARALGKLVHCEAEALGRLRKRAEVARHRSNVQRAAACFADGGPHRRKAAHEENDAPQRLIRHVVQRRRRRVCEHCHRG
jgi:hypothetical protein